MLKQRTIKSPVSIQGVSLFSGDTTTIKLSPANPNNGIRFFTNARTIINTSSDSVINTMLSTNINDVYTIEHLMSALHALHIDNIDISVNGDSIPILDGSSLQYYYLIKSAGYIEQNVNKKYIRVDKNIVIQDTEKYISIEPYDGLIITMSIKFQHPCIGKQEYTFDLYNDDYEKEIAPARTFGFLKDLSNISDLIKGASFDNAIVLDHQEVVNTDLLYPDEFVRHKLLDFIGDIYIDGPILGKINTCCTGHSLNNHLMKKIKNKT